jgi:hypothetical protein
MEPLCWLLYVSVLACDPRAQAYTEAAQSVPGEHWQLVQQVRIWDFPFAAADISTGEIVLSSSVDPIGLWHEVGHFVGSADAGRLEELFGLIFWYQGRPRWSSPSSLAVPSISEDFAESYARFIEGSLQDCCPERARWMRDTVPGLADYEGRGVTCVATVLLEHPH